MSRVLVTGATGFIGRYAVRALASAGHEVHAVSSRPVEGHDARWHQWDLLDPASSARLIEAARPTHLLHLAWGSLRSGSWESLEHLQWLEASSRLWREFHASGGRRSVLVGSCTEYEWGSPRLSERSTPLRPATLYGASKDALRRTIESAAQTLGSSMAWARIFFVYGAHERPDRLVPWVVSRLLAGRTAPITEGRQVRDYLHVADVGAALVAVLESDVEGPINLGAGRGVAIRELVELLSQAVGRPELVEVGALPTPPDDPPEIVADVSRLREEVGWRPSIELAEGVAEVIEQARVGVRGL